MAQENECETVYEGKHLSMMRRGHWEFAKRNTKNPVVGIVAITDHDKVVLVEQYRPPIGSSMIELPAGLAGDIDGLEDESLLEAAKRELLEETGYTARSWTELACGYSSPGLTNESIVIFLAEGLEKQGLGGGDETESITIHEVAMENIISWLAENKAHADLKLFAGLYATQSYINQRGSSRE